MGRAQQPTMPVVGLPDQRAPDELADRLRVLSDLERGCYFSAPKKIHARIGGGANETDFP